MTRFSSQAYEGLAMGKRDEANGHPASEAGAILAEAQVYATLSVAAAIREADNDTILARIADRLHDIETTIADHS